MMLEYHSQNTQEYEDVILLDILSRGSGVKRGLASKNKFQSCINSRLQKPALVIIPLCLYKVK